MVEQQPLIQGYVDLLLQRLRENCDGGRRALDVTQWYNWATFDIVGDLAFGEPFDGLARGQYHPWVATIFEALTSMTMITALLRFEFIGQLLPLFLIPRAFARKMQEHDQLSELKVDKRLSLPTERADLVGKMVANSRKHGAEMSHAELVANAAVLIIAGSETTAALLCGATYLVGTHPAVLAKLAREVRTSFQSEDEIDLVSTQRLKYLHAVLEESLRFFPPAVGSMPRRIMPGGDQIVDRHVPGGVRFLSSFSPISSSGFLSACLS